MLHRDKALLRTAAGAPCLGRFDGGCDGGGASGTTVWAHSPLGEHGHGMGVKSHDCYGAILCRSCHDLVDGRRDPLPRLERAELFIAAMHRTMLYLWMSGLVHVRASDCRRGSHGRDRVA